MSVQVSYKRFSIQTPINTYEGTGIPDKLPEYLTSPVKENPPNIVFSDLPHDKIASYLLGIGIITEDYEITDKYRNIGLPPLQQEEIERYKNILSSKYSFILCNGEILETSIYEVSFETDSWIPRDNKISNKKLVGGAVMYILGSSYWIRVFTNLGASDIDRYIPPKMKEEFDRKPYDVDTRTYSKVLQNCHIKNIKIGLINNLAKKAFETLGIDYRIGYSLIENTLAESSPGFRDSCPYLIACLGNVDHFVSGGEKGRDILFSRNGVFLPLVHFSKTPDETIPKGSKKYEGSGLQSGISMLTKTVLIPNPEEINHFGWFRMISLLCSEYTFPQSGVEDVLKTKCMKYVAQKFSDSSNSAAL